MVLRTIDAQVPRGAVYTRSNYRPANILWRTPHAAENITQVPLGSEARRTTIPISGRARSNYCSDCKISGLFSRASARTRPFPPTSRAWATSRINGHHCTSVCVLLSSDLILAYRYFVSYFVQPMTSCLFALCSQESPIRTGTSCSVPVPFPFSFPLQH